MMLAGKSIVVIDDTESIRNFLRVALEAHNAIVHTAATAAGGLALCEQELPDLVVLDIGLPDSEGLTILPRLKRLRKATPPAVVMLTVRKEQRFIEKAKELGADAYLIKPCFVEDVIEVIENLLGINKTPHFGLVVPENVPSLPGEDDILLIKSN
jgi:two-component system KDP operon response regulator KdpE